MSIEIQLIYTSFALQYNELRLPMLYFIQWNNIYIFLSFTPNHIIHLLRGTQASLFYIGILLF